MRRPLLAATLLLGSFCLSPAAHAQLNGERLLQICEQVLELHRPSGSRTADLLDVGICTGFIVAVSQGGAGAIYCPPQGATVYQMAGVLTKWLNDRPEKWHSPALGVALSAFEDSFPCSDAPR